MFAKLIRQVEVAAREGGPDPDMNPSLRTMYQKARDQSVPLDTIEKAIKRGSGTMEGVSYEQITYETSAFVTAQAQKKGYAFVGEPLVRFMVDPSLKSGKFAVFADRARTGATIIGRDGLLDLMEAARSRKFDAVIVESLDRLSRDQEELAGIFKRLEFAGVSILTALVVFLTR